MKTATAAATTHISQECTTLCMAVKVILQKYQPLIVNITKANPGVVEVEWAPGYLTGDNARIVGGRGMTELNGDDVVLTRIDDTHFSIGQNTTGFGTYSGKGELRKILGFTEHVRDLSFEGVTYKAAIGYMPKSIKGGSDLSVDNMEIAGLMPSKVRAQAQGMILLGLSDEDLDVGRFDNARVELFWLNYKDLTQGRIIMPGSGNIGQIHMMRGLHQSELRGLTHMLQQVFGDLYSKLCRAQLGDDIGDGTGVHDYKKGGFGCKVRLDPPFWKVATAYTVRPPFDAALGSVVKPTVFNNRHYKCTVAGTSHATTEPTWPLRIGATVVDNTATWEAFQALRVFGSVSSVLDTRFFTDNARGEPPTTGQGVNTGTAQYAIRKVNTSADWFEIDGNLVSFFVSGNTFTVTGSTANDGTYTVASAALNGARTRITVVEAVPSNKASGTIGAPLLVASGFFAFGKLTFLTGANKGIAKEVKDFSLTAYPLVALNQGAQRFEIAGNQTAFFAVNQRFGITGSTGNDGNYDVVTATFNGGTSRTEIVVFQAIVHATADGEILGPPGTFEMFERFPFTIVAADTYVATAGCDIGKDTCKVKFDNIKNLRAEVEIPGQDVAGLFPNQAGGGIG